MKNEELKKISIIDYLVNRILKHDKSFLEFYSAEITEAKEIEKEQIKDVYIDGLISEMIKPLDRGKYKKQSEEYYKENYG